MAVVSTTAAATAPKTSRRRLVARREFLGGHAPPLAGYPLPSRPPGVGYPQTQAAEDARVLGEALLEPVHDLGVQAPARLRGRIGEPLSKMRGHPEQEAIDVPRHISERILNDLGSDIKSISPENERGRPKAAPLLLQSRRPLDQSRFSLQVLSPCVAAYRIRSLGMISRLVDLDVRQPRRGARPRRGAGRQAQRAEVGPGIQITRDVVSDEIVDGQVAEVVRPVDPRRRPRPGLYVDLDDVARRPGRVHAVAAVRDPRAVPVRGIHVDARHEPVRVDRRVVIEPRPRHCAGRTRRRRSS